MAEVPAVQHPPAPPVPGPPGPWAKGHLEGDADKIITQGANGPKNLVEYQKYQAGSGVRAKTFTFINGNSSGGATVYVGPNNKAQFPLLPPASAGAVGQSQTWENVDPAKMCIDDHGTQSTVYFTYGGESDPDTASR